MIERIIHAILCRHCFLVADARSRWNYAAPEPEPGRYSLRFDVVREGVHWLEEEAVRSQPH